MANPTHIAPAVRIVYIGMVRNEAAILARHLDSVLPHVDAAVITDTGSTDDTVEHARAALVTYDVPGLVTTQRPWRSFGYNRTWSLYDAVDWVRAHRAHWALGQTYGLVLDADMMLTDPLPRDALTAHGYHVMQRQGAMEFPNIRLMRLDAPWRCVGATHEMWVADGLPLAPHLPPARMTVLDLNDGRCKADKHARDLKLLRGDMAAAIVRDCARARSAEWEAARASVAATDAADAAAYVAEHEPAEDARARETGARAEADAVYARAFVRMMRTVTAWPDARLADACPDARPLYYAGQAAVGMHDWAAAATWLRARTSARHAAAYAEETYMALLFLGDAYAALQPRAAAPLEVRDGPHGARLVELDGALTSAAVTAWMRAACMRPQRADAWARLARHFREQSDAQVMGMMFAAAGLRSALGVDAWRDGALDRDAVLPLLRVGGVPEAERDTLFLSRRASDTDLWQEISICAGYFRAPQTQAAGVRAVNHVVLHAVHASEAERAQALRNLTFYALLPQLLPCVWQADILVGDAPSYAPLADAPRGTWLGQAAPPLCVPRPYGWSDAEMGNFGPTNPSIRAHPHGFFELVLRMFNAATPNAREWVHFPGPCPSGFVTRNLYVSVTDLKYATVVQELLTPPPLPAHAASHIVGVEDVRLVQGMDCFALPPSEDASRGERVQREALAEHIVATGTHIQWTPHGRHRQALVRWPLAGGPWHALAVEGEWPRVCPPLPCTDLVTLPSPVGDDAAAAEKNWLPFMWCGPASRCGDAGAAGAAAHPRPSADLCVLYGYAPLTVYAVNAVDGSLRMPPLVQHDMGAYTPAFRRFRGSAGPVPWGAAPPAANEECWLVAVHDVAQVYDGGRTYFQRWLTLDGDMRPVRASRLWRLCGERVHYLSGLAPATCPRTGKEGYVLTYGVRDHAARMAFVSTETIRAALCEHVALP